MPDGRLERTRLAYRIDFDAGDGPMRPTVRCICGSDMNEPHAPECYRLKIEQEIEPDYLTGRDPDDETPWGV